MLLKSFLRFSPVFLCLILPGCGGESVAPPVPVYPTSGKITYKGQPVVGADVTFMNAEKNRSAFGKTDAEGNYKLTTFTQNDGCVEGKAIVTVKKYEAASPEPAAASVDTEAYEPPGVGQDTGPKKAKSDIPDKYGDPKLSGLIAPVLVDSPNVFDFVLE